MKQMISCLNPHNLTMNTKKEQVSEAVNTHPELIRVAGNASVFPRITFEKPSTHKGFFDQPVPNGVSSPQFLKALISKNGQTHYLTVFCCFIE